MATPAPDGITIPALAAQIADLRGDVRYVKARVEQGNVPIHGLAALRAQVDELAAAVADLTQEETPPRAVAPYWLDLDPEDRDMRLADLGGWVTGVLAVNYPHCAPLPCWANHPAAIWELSTLQAEWHRVYSRKYPDLPGALAFHDRHLPGVTERLKGILCECSKAGCDLAR